MMRRPFYMDSTRAKEFGVIDKVSSYPLILCFFLCVVSLVSSC